MTPIQRIVVTGAGGFVMSNVIPALLEAGWQVIALDRAFDPKVRSAWAARWGDRVVFHEREAGHLSDLRAEAILHGAAVTASPEDLGQSPEANLRANLDPALAALEWAQEQGARALLVSSSAVYRATEPGPVTEALPADPQGVYAVAKHALESFTRTVRESDGRDALVVRLSNIYGLDEQPRPSRPRTSLVGRLLTEALTTGAMTVHAHSADRDWTFAPDVGRAVLALLRLERPQHALYNLASGHVMNTQEIARAIQSVLPDVRLNILSENDPQIPFLTRRGWLSSQRLADETGFSDWTPFSDGLRQIVAAQASSEAV